MMITIKESYFSMLDQVPRLVCSDTKCLEGLSLRESESEDQLCDRCREILVKILSDALHVFDEEGETVHMLEGLLVRIKRGIKADRFWSSIRGS